MKFDQINAVVEQSQLMGNIELSSEETDPVSLRLAMNIAAWKMIQLSKEAFDFHGSGLEEIKISWSMAHSRKSGRFMHAIVQLEGPDVRPYDPRDWEHTAINSPGLHESVVDLAQVIKQTCEIPRVYREYSLLSDIFVSPLRSIKDCDEALLRVDPLVLSALERVMINENTLQSSAPSTIRRMRVGSR